VVTLNEAFSKLSMRRRYEVWFVRLGLVDGSGAWWFRYLLMNPGRGGCPADSRGMPVQVWATWFPALGKPETFMQHMPLSELQISERNKSPFRLAAGQNEIGEGYCRGDVDVEGHRISWDLQYRSTFRVTLSSKGWIGFSRTPHSDAVFSGEITFDGRHFKGCPLAFGVQGHNCGYRHRNFWKWTHAYFLRENGPATTLEALIYEMPLGLVFRKAVLWHEGRAETFRKVTQAAGASAEMKWSFDCVGNSGLKLHASVDGRGASEHRIPYVRTDCGGTFQVRNNSLSSASIVIESPGGQTETLQTTTGAVLELVG
jgi:hypothetical protein